MKRVRLSDGLLGAGKAERTGAAEVLKGGKTQYEHLSLMCSNYLAAAQRKAMHETPHLHHGHPRLIGQQRAQEGLIKRRLLGGSVALFY